jgi:hypothetical protein
MDEEEFQRQMNLIAERHAKFDEQFQRHVNFMLAQQAKFDERQAKSEAQIARLEQVALETREDITKLVDVVMSLATHVERHDQQIAALIDENKETERRFQETDERINALINLAEQYFNRNGK